MKIIKKLAYVVSSFAVTTYLFASNTLVYAQNPTGECQADPNASGCISIGGVQVPSFTTLLGALIQLFFVLSGVAALIFLVWGAFAWVTSGGEKAKVEEAQKKIIAAVVGLIVLVAVLSLAVFLEQVVFGGNFCFGISCPINTSELQLIPTAPTVTPIP